MNIDGKKFYQKVISLFKEGIRIEWSKNIFNHELKYCQKSQY